MSTAVELAAYASFVVAGWLIAPSLGLVVLGGVLLLVAHALEGAKVKMPKVRMPKVSLPKVSVRLPGQTAEATKP